MRGRGQVRVPGDKSISHRALILGALASGESHVTGILQSADVHSTASVLRGLGVAIPDLSDSLRFTGKGLRSLRPPNSALYAGNSGTTVRLMSGVAAAHPFATRFEGDASLSRRPMKRIAEPLTQMGARFEFARNDGLPMTIHGGRLSGIVWNTRASSAQTKGAILLAGLSAGVQVTVTEQRKSRDHTERMLTSLGAPVESDELSVSLSPVDSLAPMELSVPGDPSSAAFFIAFAVLGGADEIEIPKVCINRTRTGFIDVLKKMGARIEYAEREAVAGDMSATIIAKKSRIHGATIDGSQVPSMIDELPLLACVAAAAGVQLEVRDAEELRVKESDRIIAVVRNLRAVGAIAEELPDGFVVGRRSGRLAGHVATESDHRIAMAFGILGALPGNAIDMDNRDCVDVSFPRFWQELERLK